VETVAVVLLIVGLLLTGLAAAAIMRLRTRVTSLADRADAIAQRIDALPPDLTRVFGGRDRHVISVELLNLFEVAHKETWVARPLSMLAPRTLTDVIHRHVVGKVRENLKAAGVEAEVRLHRVR
jgi:hypothetical protein